MPRCRRSQERSSDQKLSHIGAVAASILTAVYHMLKDGTSYHYLGANHFDHHAKHAQTSRLLARLKNLGYDVQITPVTA